MLFLAMKPEIQIDLLSNFGDSHNTATGFSVPVDASNLYIEFSG
jgi:hypothetical protein